MNIFLLIFVSTGLLVAVDFTKSDKTSQEVTQKEMRLKKYKVKDGQEN